MPLKPVTVSTTLTVDAKNPTAAVVTQCQVSGAKSMTFKQFFAPTVSLNSANGFILGVDFNAFIPAADQAKVIAIQVTVGNPLAQEVATGNIGPSVQIQMDGQPVFVFEFDTSTDNERRMTMTSFLVTPGAHTFTVISNNANILPFPLQITGYFLQL